MSDDQANSRQQLLDEFNDSVAVITQLLSEGDAGVALSRLKRQPKRFHGLVEYSQLMGKCHQAKKKIDHAITWFLKAIDLDRNRLESYQYLIALYEEQEQIDKAIDLLLQAARDSDDRLQFYYWLHAFLRHYGREETAKEVIDELKSSIKEGPLFYKLGRAAYDINLCSAAIDYFRRSLEHEYLGPNVYLFLAESLKSCGFVKCAKYFYRKILAADASNAAGIEGFYRLHLNNDSEDESITEALVWEHANLQNDLEAKLNIHCLGPSEKEFQEILEKAIDPDDVSLTDETSLYFTFSTFYIGILLNEPNHSSRHFSPLKSLRSCVARLEDIGDLPATRFCRAWLSALEGKTDIAHHLFEQLGEQSESLSEELREGTERGLQYVQSSQNGASEKTGSVEEKLVSFGTVIKPDDQKEMIVLSNGLREVVGKMIGALTQSPARSILLVGPSGVGKTAAVRQLANLIAESEEGSGRLSSFKIFQTSTTEIISGAKFIGVWQEKLSRICQLASLDNRFIIYFEDMANLFGVGRTVGDQSRFADYLIPRIEAGNIAIIGEMDAIQAQQLLTQESRFERVVAQIEVQEPNRDEVADILKTLASQEGNRRSIQFDQGCIDQVLNLTDIFLPYKAFPGKALDLFRATCDALVRDDEKDVGASADDVVLTFCDSTGVPDFIVDRGQLLDPDKMKTFFNERVLGQNEATKSLMRSVTTFKARLNDPRRPIDSFLFVGPTGVGKTESAKVLAEFLFGSSDRIIRLNMSEYNNYDAVSRLIGTSDDLRSSGFLDKVRRTPFSVILLDEIEKAHPDMFNLLLQMLDEGILSDARGKPAFFQSAIVIMTSNIGARRYTKRSIGFGDESNISEVQEAVLSDVRDFFTPEIFNRFDQVVCFEPLSKGILGKIINREIGKILERRGILSSGVSVEVDPIVRENIMDVGYDPRYGARNIKRAVENAVAVPLAGLMTTVDIREGSLVRVNLVKGLPTAVVACIDEPGSPATSIRVLNFDNLQIPDKSLRKTLESMAERIDALKAKFSYDDLLLEKDELQHTMVRPNFWDDPSGANMILRKFAEQNRTIERVHRWERNYELIGSLVTASATKRTKQDMSRARSSIIGLIKDLESAEMEILLEGKYDSADTFIMLSIDGQENENLKWLIELTDVYTSWARKRGYQYKIFGEGTGSGASDYLILLHIRGLNAFGLLKNERGIHRKTVSSKLGSRKHGSKTAKTNKLDCAVAVLADVQPLQGSAEPLDLNIQKVKPTGKGRRIKSLSRHVNLAHSQLDTKLSFLSERSIEKDRNLLEEFFMSYIHYLERKRASRNSSDSDVWGSLVRTYEFGDKSRIVDLRTKIVFQNPKDYLSGKIDSLLLERLV